jgi:tryptophan synthase alpha chain
MTRIERKFRALRKADKKAFIAFITAGYPDLSTTEKLILEFDRIGVDIIELGVPFSDPMADGPVIQEASRLALQKKVNLKSIIDLVKRVRQYTEIPICLMTYYNPIFCFGEKQFARLAQSSGVDGIIVPDLPPEEAKDLHKLATKHNLDLIYFIAPTTSKERIKHIVSISKGFIYYVSLTGVTGIRQALPAGLKNHLQEIKQMTSKPLCVGFGISTPAQVQEVYRIADGVIVGSAIVKKIKENIGKLDLVKSTGRFVNCLISR